MAHRTIEIQWTPRTKEEWKIFTAMRLESARLWGDLVDIHAKAREEGSVWPWVKELRVAVVGKYPELNSQSVQETVREFVDSIKSTLQLKKKDPDVSHEFAHHKPKYKNVSFTYVAARVRDGFLILPSSKGKPSLRIRIPKGVTLPGKLQQVRLMMGKVEIVCKTEDETKVPSGAVVGIDLGVNTLIAATDGETALMISGRGVKSFVRERNKRLGQICALQSGHAEGSIRYKKLQRAKAKMLQKNHNRISNACHNATRAVVNAFPGAKIVVGEPFNGAAKKPAPELPKGVKFKIRKKNQNVSAACNRKMISQLEYKSGLSVEVPEHFTSQTCPVCGERNLCLGRIYKCRKCNLKAPRDVVGSSNIRSIGMNGKMVKGCSVPNTIFWKYPITYLRRKVVSSPGDTRQVALYREPRTG